MSDIRKTPPKEQKKGFMLRRAVKFTLITVFSGITTPGIVFAGYLFNRPQAIII